MGMTGCYSSGHRYPNGPFLAWIEDRITEQRCAGALNPIGAVADLLGVSDRRIYEWRRARTVDESVVDRALSADGRWHLRDLYPDRRRRRYDVQLTKLAADAVELPDQCARPGCSAQHNGGRFCHTHTEELARIRAEFDQEGAASSANGGVPVHQARRKSSVPVCCAPGCHDIRTPGERFCADCRAAGWSEDDDGVTNAQLEEMMA